MRERRAEIETWLGLRAVDRSNLRAMLALGIDAAASTDRGEPIVSAMVDQLRAARVVLPAASTLERVALIARAQARRAAFADLIRELTPAQADVRRNRPALVRRANLDLRVGRPHRLDDLLRGVGKADLAAAAMLGIGAQYSLVIAKLDRLLAREV